MKDQEMKIIIVMEIVVTTNMVILKVRDCAIQQLLIQFFNMRPITTTINDELHWDLDFKLSKTSLGIANNKMRFCIFFT